MADQSLGSRNLLDHGGCRSAGLTDQQGDRAVTLHIPHLQPLAAILAGVLILFVPRILNYVVAAYLTLVGILGFGLIR
jgi:hypothetical protein